MTPRGAGADPPLRHHPYLKPWYAVVASDERLLLEFGGTVVTLEGAALKHLVPALLPLLDGTRTVDQIVGRLGGPARPAVEKALALLGQHGALTEGPPVTEDPPAFARTAEAFAAGRRDGPSPAEIRERLGGARIAVAGTTGLAEDVARLLFAGGVSAVESVAWDAEGLGQDAAVAIAAPAELPLLRAWSRNRNDDGVAWLAVPPYDGRVAPVGPFVVPRETACFQCYELRRAATTDCREELRAIDSDGTPERSAPPLDAVVASTAALVLLRWLGGSDLVTPGAFYAFELSTPLSLQLHRVLRVPRCPACSPAAGAAPLPWFKVVSAHAA